MGQRNSLRHTFSPVKELGLRGQRLALQKNKYGSVKEDPFGLCERYWCESVKVARAGERELAEELPVRTRNFTQERHGLADVLPSWETGLCLRQIRDVIAYLKSKQSNISEVSYLASSACMVHGKDPLKAVVLIQFPSLKSYTWNGPIRAFAHDAFEYFLRKNRQNLQRLTLQSINASLLQARSIREEYSKEISLPTNEDHFDLPNLKHLSISGDLHDKEFVQAIVNKVKIASIESLTLKSPSLEHFLKRIAESASLPNVNKFELSFRESRRSYASHNHGFVDVLGAFPKLERLYVLINPSDYYISYNMYLENICGLQPFIKRFVWHQRDQSNDFSCDTLGRLLSMTKTEFMILRHSGLECLGLSTSFKSIVSHLSHQTAIVID